ncbi:hypothetical protein GCM10010954_18440 [Halobacillus andaensis]|uniref:Uncharacterized protein n=1 Tax=Halobacillus andaensis TaxID=1176239 RepID=A0A917EUY9_HALAA|nr:hypothetical protein [Halobacillus andaensis]MBP2004653.1 hypothetical protein [Halobacillus andaensis]GGF19973.1 hypothetical protein GCM10010954_18440 [Halobacillus andaensis]
MRDNVKPIFPVTEEFLELVDLLNKVSDSSEDQVIPHTMTVLNRVYAQGIMEGYQKAIKKQNNNNESR